MIILSPSSIVKFYCRIFGKSGSSSLTSSIFQQDELIPNCHAMSFQKESSSILFTPRVDLKFQSKHRTNLAFQSNGSLSLPNQHKLDSHRSPQANWASEIRPIYSATIHTIIYWCIVLKVAICPLPYHLPI